MFDPNGRTSGGRVYSGAHVERVYDKYIEDRFLSKKDCKIKNVLIVCHSAGGMSATTLLNDKQKYLLSRIRGVAGTDTFFGHAKNKKVQQVYKRYVVNWVASSQSTGTILSNTTIPKRVSAGHNSHEYTSAAAFPQIISYFDSHMKLYNKNQNKNDKDDKNDNNDNVVDDKEEKEIKETKEKPTFRDESEIEKEENKMDAEPNNVNDDDDTMKDDKDEIVTEKEKEKEKEVEDQCDVDDKGDKEQTDDAGKEKEVDDKSKEEEENNDKMDVDS